MKIMKNVVQLYFLKMLVGSNVLKFKLNFFFTFDKCVNQ